MQMRASRTTRAYSVLVALALVSNRNALTNTNHAGALSAIKTHLVSTDFASLSDKGETVLTFKSRYIDIHRHLLP